MLHNVVDESLVVKVSMSYRMTYHISWL